MKDRDQLLSSESIQMLVTSMTRKGEVQLSELEVERFLNAIARAESGTPTGPIRPE